MSHRAGQHSQPGQQLQDPHDIDNPNNETPEWSTAAGAQGFGVFQSLLANSRQSNQHCSTIALATLFNMRLDAFEQYFRQHQQHSENPALRTYDITRPYHSWAMIIAIGAEVADWHDETFRSLCFVPLEILDPNTSPARLEAIEDSGANTEGINIQQLQAVIHQQPQIQNVALQISGINNNVDHTVIGFVSGGQIVRITDYAVTNGANVSEELLREGEGMYMGMYWLEQGQLGQGGGAAPVAGH